MPPALKILKKIFSGFGAELRVYGLNEICKKVFDFPSPFVTLNSRPSCVSGCFSSSYAVNDFRSILLQMRSFKPLRFVINHSFWIFFYKKTFLKAMMGLALSVASRMPERECVEDRVQRLSRVRRRHFLIIEK